MGVQAVGLEGAVQLEKKFYGILGNKLFKMTLNTPFSTLFLPNLLNPKIFSRILFQSSMGTVGHPAPNPEAAADGLLLGCAPPLAGFPTAPAMPNAAWLGFQPAAPPVHGEGDDPVAGPGAQEEVAVHHHRGEGPARGAVPRRPAPAWASGAVGQASSGQGLNVQCVPAQGNEPFTGSRLSF